MTKKFGHPCHKIIWETSVCNWSMDSLIDTSASRCTSMSTPRLEVLKLWLASGGRENSKTPISLLYLKACSQECFINFVDTEFLHLKTFFCFPFSCTELLWYWKNKVKYVNWTGIISPFILIILAWRKQSPLSSNVLHEGFWVVMQSVTETVEETIPVLKIACIEVEVME